MLLLTPLLILVHGLDSRGFLLEFEMKELVTKDLTTTSLALAELFGKNHKDVLRVIRNIIKDINADDLGRRNFALSSYRNEQNKEQPMFIMGEEMTLIITGRLTGKEALSAQMKLADAFIVMRNFIQNSQSKLSADDERMLRLTRINPNCLKAITGSRNNNEVRENYKALIEAGLLEAHTKIVFKRVYLPTAKGLDYVKTSHHDIVRFKPKYHDLIIEAVGEYREKLSCDNADLFLEI